MRFAHVLIAAITILGFGIFYTQAAYANSTQILSKQKVNQACPQLPSNFDPEAASSSELRHFHLPPPPTNVTQRAAWVEQLKHIKHIDCNDSFTSTNLHSYFAPTSNLSENSANDIYSMNWSGYQVKNDTYDNVKANWHTQCLGSNQNSVVLLATWVGIGGVNAPQLWQAGTIYTNSDGLYHPWWEAYPHNSIQVDYNISAGCGVTVSAEAYLSGTNWCYYVNVGGFVSSGCPISTNVFFVHESTAEWIDERPHCSNGFSHLADFNTTGWSNVYAHSTVHGWHTLEGFSSDKDHMVQNNQLLLAQPDNPSSSTTFTDRYKNKDTDGVNCYL